MSRRYTAVFKRDAVASALSSEKTVTEVARDLDVSPEGLRGWVKQAKADRGEGPAGALTTTEREELVRLPRKVREQEATIEVLGKATAFFDQDKTRQTPRHGVASSMRRRHQRVIPQDTVSCFCAVCWEYPVPPTTRTGRHGRPRR
ncbi:transposase [Streptomyces sp. NPDC092307]|uniref:transposase n=1 Tax=Streptomyces sp. NPDC092307 TaxID=3366013 RepID=UPI0037F27E61